MMRPTLLGLLAFSLLAAPDAHADAQASQDEDSVVLAAQDASVDADGGRDAKFERQRDLPSGIVIESLRWSGQNENRWVRIEAFDLSQRDQRFRAEAGLGPRVRLRAHYQSTPQRYGGGAVSVLGRGPNDMFGATYRLADFIQQRMEDPDGNGTPFFTDAAETAIDNPLVNALANDLVAGQGTFSLGTVRREGGAGATFDLGKGWSLDLDASVETRNGIQPLGTGTYQRITDVNGDGVGDYDYVFSNRGVELPGIVDYRTTRLSAGTSHLGDGWFFSARASASEFDNSFAAITYDNPFWFTDIDATSGSRRGLWQQGRVSLEPSNDAWDLSFAGGVSLPGKTRIDASFTIGEHRQNEPFLPITTNTATIGTVDLNRDGLVNANDDPTRAPSAIVGLPATIGGFRTIGASLDGTAETRAIALTVTSRPVDGLTLLGRFREYEYDGRGPTLVVPARAEYIESTAVLTHHGELILHIPRDFSRQTIDLEAGWRFREGVKIKAFAGRRSREYARYADRNANGQRDAGVRAVAGTDEDFVGASAMFRGGNRFSGRITIENADREVSGAYVNAFSGELATLRQFDIAARERDSANVQLDFMPVEAVTLGIGYRTAEDDYPGSVYGLQKGKASGTTLSVNWAANERVSVFAHADLSSRDADMHLRTKCSNCSEPDPALVPWDVPNFDWFTAYRDDTRAVGAGASFAVGRKTNVDLSANWTKGKIEQSNRNPATPLEGDPGNPRFGEVATVALASNFPDQENELLATELRISHRLGKRLTAGIFWLYEDFDLDDFQWDGLEPYGANFLTVDDSTRYLFLDSRYRDYTAHVVQLFVKIAF